MSNNSNAYRIVKFEILKHNFFPAQTFFFTDDVISENGPYVTLLIGPNGTGKSQLLEAIIKVFNILLASKERGVKVQKFEISFNLEYFIDNNKVIINSNNNNDFFSINNIESDFISIPLPAKVLALANNLGDRFPFLTKKSKTQNSAYEYLGIRTASNNAFKNYNTLIDRFSTSLLLDTNIDRYKNIFNLLDLEPEITIVYKAGKNLTIDKKTNRFKDVLNEVDLFNKFDAIISKIDTNNRFTFRKDKYSNVIFEEKNSDSRKKNLTPNKENLILITEFIKNYNNSINLKSTKSSIRYQSNIKFDEQDTIDIYKEKSHVLQLIRDLEIFEVDKLILHRKKSKYGFDQASSGEHHILSGFINLISTINNNSIIFIDEPEISLHPNWQIKYMNLLQSTFCDFNDCHFIISTHSHFLVSDLIPNKSAIISLKINENGRPINTTLEYDTYGWSTENILYRVFEVSSTRNHYLEMELRELLSMISNKSENFERMIEIVKSLNKFKNLTESDPLLKIINTAITYLKSNGY